ncbi:Uncharacterised protein [Mycobacteroides abscessus subsp. abscessus]|nr:Uncharacterised protein [Mycobacteroides abscessus subsp. abscessus]
MDVRPFQQCVGIDQPLKLLGGDEVIVDTVHLTRPRGPGGRGNAEEQTVDLIA